MGAENRGSREENGGGKKKSDFQLRSLEGFYSEEKYPGRRAMEEYATYLGLAYNQVRVWFSERRRKEKRIVSRAGPRKRTGKEVESSSRGTGDGELESLESGGESDGGIGGSGKRAREASDRVRWGSGSSMKRPRGQQIARVQVLLSQDDIIRSVFRKDGPPLGNEFDPVPARGFDCHTRCGKHPPFSSEIKAVTAKRKVLEISKIGHCGHNNNDYSTRRHGIGKGLMTVWRATNPRGDFAIGLSSSDRGVARKLMSNGNSRKNMSTRANMQHVRNQSLKKFREKINERRKHQLRRMKVQHTKNSGKNVKQKLPSVGCGLLCSETEFPGEQSSSSKLMDDEELELSELQSGPNPFRCAAHLTSNGEIGCPLCKDMLSQFPPQSVNMKMPFCSKPWLSSPTSVKKLFKVFQFLYTSADRINVGTFTLDELAEGFQERDSVLLGMIHVTLLKVLLSIVHVAISSGVPRPSKDCRFLGFMHSVKQQDLDVAFWVESLNALTWTEILRLVSVAAGFGSVGCTRRESSDKEDNAISRYDLRPLTLRHELFYILAEQGSNGLKISELAKAVQKVSLGLPSGTDDLECLIFSTLSSDISLFEKIGNSSFRLRLGLSHKKEEKSDCGSDDSGSIDNDHLSSNSNNSFDECEIDSASHVQSIEPYKGSAKKKNKRTNKCMEIDESFSGEAWLMGLIEGEYSDLSIEEKLDAMASLVDLTNSALCLGIDEATVIMPILSYCKSGGKIKKAQHQPAPNEFPSSNLREFDKGFNLLEHDHTAQNFQIQESLPHLHTLQAINLGSDRRYNRYWLFLGPCEKRDPGHRRVYFESSEDGHWEVIDTKQALSSLMLALDCRGSRESQLLSSLEKRQEFLGKAMTEHMEMETGFCLRRLTDSPYSDAFSGNGSSLISDVDNNAIVGGHTDTCTVSTGVLVGKNNEIKCADVRQSRVQLELFDKWICTSFLGSLNAVKKRKSSFHDTLVRCERCHDLFWMDDKHCKICHITFELDFDLEEKYALHVATCSESDVISLSTSYNVLPSQLQALKAAVYALEAAMPEEALVRWTKSSHNLWGKRLRRTSSMAEFLLVVKDFIGAIKEDWLCKCALDIGLEFLGDLIVQFQTIPQTVAAVALWMVKLDILIAPYIENSKNSDATITKPESKRMRTRAR